MQPLYTAVKVNNEIELCEVTDQECKKEIERELLRNRISYFIRYPKTSFFRANKSSCIICVNDNVKESAIELVKNLCKENHYEVKFLLKHSTNHYL